jgi:hypothetical protein
MVATYLANILDIWVMIWDSFMAERRNLPQQGKIQKRRSRPFRRRFALLARESCRSTSHNHDASTVKLTSEAGGRSG